MTLTGILFIALMALLIVYLVIMLNNAIEDARLYGEMRNGAKKKKGGIPKMDTPPMPPPPFFNEKEQKEYYRLMPEAGERIERRGEERLQKLKDEKNKEDELRRNMERLSIIEEEIKRLNFKITAIMSTRNDLPRLVELLKKQMEDAVVQNVYQCPKCHGRGVLVDPTDTRAIKCHICKGEGRVEL